MLEFLFGGLVAIVGGAFGGGLVLVSHALDLRDERHPDTTEARLRRDARENEQKDEGEALITKRLTVPIGAVKSSLPDRKY